MERFGNRLSCAFDDLPGALCRAYGYIFGANDGSFAYFADAVDWVERYDVGSSLACVFRGHSGAFGCSLANVACA
jgi:hypothetical protein